MGKALGTSLWGRLLGIGRARAQVQQGQASMAKGQ
jgi:hypothetical protein